MHEELKMEFKRTFVFSLEFEIKVNGQFPILLLKVIYKMYPQLPPLVYILFFRFICFKDFSSFMLKNASYVMKNLLNS